MKIYKILMPLEWQELQNTGVLQGAPVDLSDGFIHFSTHEQLEETARKHFANKGALILLECEAARFGDALKWEPSRGGALFPHLYRALSRDDILQSWSFISDQNGPQLPECLQ